MTSEKRESRLLHAARNRMGQAERAIEYVSPHLTWILGLLLLLEIWFEGGLYHGLAQEPEGTLFFMGFLLLVSGRNSLRYRKKYHKERRESDRYKEQFEEMQEAYYDEID